MFIDDFANIFIFDDSRIVLYADDSSLIVFGRDRLDLVYKMRAELRQVQTFCNQNRLMINVSKTKCMIFNNIRKYNFSNCFTVNNSSIEVVNHFKYLGFHLDDSLRFDTHINYLVSKISSCNAVLCRSRQYIPQRSSFLIFNSIGLSYILDSKMIHICLSYNCLRPLRRKLIQSGTIIYNCVSRYLNYRRFDLSFVLRFYCYIFIYKVLHLNFAPQLNEFFIRHNTYNTRASSFFVPSFSKSICKKIFLCSASF